MKKGNYDFSKFQDILNKSAPIRKKIFCHDHNTFMSESLKKLCKPKNKYNKNKTEENWSNYKKQRDFCVNMQNDFNIKNLSTDRNSEIVTSCFSGKGLNSNAMMMAQNMV